MPCSRRRRARRAKSSSPPPCPTPTGTSTWATWSSTSRPTSGCAFRSCAGNECIYICADDTHGTAIMIRARQEGRSEEALIADMQRGPRARLRRLRHRVRQLRQHQQPREPRAVRRDLGEAARGRAGRASSEVTQLYDPEAGTFLADRFVKGTCPKCKSPDQYGDSCDKCGATYSPTELIDPDEHAVGHARPSCARPTHLFVNIEQLHAFLDRVDASAAIICRREVANYLAGHFLGEPLRDWDVSRPAPYFGFEIPDSPGQLLVRLVRRADRLHGLDGRSGASSTARSSTTGGASGKAEIHHFIGKDITYFHTLFWPAMLKTAGFNLPTKVHIHGFLTVDGEKMSKTKGTFVRAATYLKHLDPAYLRYYYASKLGPRARRPGPEPRRVRRQGQLRPGRQGGEPGQPHGEVRQGHGPVGQLSRRRRTVRRTRPPKATRSPRPTKPATTTGPCG